MVTETCDINNCQEKRHLPEIEKEFYCACAANRIHFDAYTPTETGASDLSGMNVSKDDLHTSAGENTWETALLTSDSAARLRTLPGLSLHTVDVSFIWKNNFTLKGTVQKMIWKPRKRKNDRMKYKQIHRQENCFTGDLAHRKNLKSFPCLQIISQCGVKIYRLSLWYLQQQEPGSKHFFSRKKKHLQAEYKEAALYETYVKQ